MKRVCPAKTLSIILSEGIILDGSLGVASCRVDRCAARRALGRKMETGNDPKHPRNINNAEYEHKESGEAESRLHGGDAALIANEIAVPVQSTAVFRARCLSESDSMQGSSRQRWGYTSSSPER